MITYNNWSILCLQCILFSFFPLWCIRRTNLIFFWCDCFRKRGCGDEAPRGNVIVNFAYYGTLLHPTSAEYHPFCFSFSKSSTAWWPQDVKYCQEAMGFWMRRKKLYTSLTMVNIHCAYIDVSITVYQPMSCTDNAVRYVLFISAL